MNQFEDGPIPVADEQQIFTWFVFASVAVMLGILKPFSCRKDATLREVLTTLRNTAPQTPEYRHPLARYTFRAIFADSGNRGRFAQKELGTVYSRDILGEPGTIDSVAPRLLREEEGPGPGGAASTETDNEREERTLEDLRFVPGDYMCVMVVLPKGVVVPPSGELSIKGAAPAVASNGWKSGAAESGRGRGDGGWGGALGTTSAPSGRGGGHWRGASTAPEPRGGGRGRGDRRVPPPRRESPPRRSGWGDRRGGRSPSRSRSPPRRRSSRYD